MKIVKTEKLQHPFVCQPGDKFELMINDHVVCSTVIEKIQTITCYALVEIPGVGLGYFIGDDNLVTELEKQCS